MSFDPVQSSSDVNAVSLESLEALGSLLRQTREARGLSLSEASHDTFIRTQYLDALERGDLSQLPEVVYVQGFLRRYADYLGLQGEILQRHSLLLAQSYSPTPIPTVSPLSRPDPHPISLRPMHLWTIYVVVVVFAVGMLSALLEGPSTPLSRWLSRDSFSTSSDQARSDLRPSAQTPTQSTQSTQSTQTPQSPQTTRLPVEESSQSPQPTPSLEPGSLATVFQDPEATDVASAQGNSVQLDIRVVERPSWLRVIADGQVEFEGTLQPGAERNWSADQSIVLRAGNAGGVLITFNNQELGVMGRFGEVKEQIFQP